MGAALRIPNTATRRSGCAKSWPLSSRRRGWGGCLWFRFNGDLYFGALLEAHFVAILIGQSIFDAQLSIEMIGPFHRDLGFLRCVRRRRFDDFFDDCGQSSTWFIAHRV